MAEKESDSGHGEALLMISLYCLLLYKPSMSYCVVVIDGF